MITISNQGQTKWKLKLKDNVILGFIFLIAQFDRFEFLRRFREPNVILLVCEAEVFN